jgi:molybdopterin-guanine dinucleotide biosynthesis protein A
MLLAGGLATRMGGGDKSLKTLGGRPILAHVIDRIRPQVPALALNANGDPARLGDWGLPIVPDALADFPGPLAGIHAGMEWARTRNITDIVSIPTDTPFLPADLVDRLLAARGKAEIAVAMSEGNAHPVVALWPARLADELHRLVTEGMRRVTDFAGCHTVAYADFPVGPVDPFLNINRPEDLERAEALIAAWRAPRRSTHQPPPTGGRPGPGRANSR